MDKILKIIDWNVSYMNDWEKKIEFLFSKLNSDFCVILQEVGPWVAQCIREGYSNEKSFVYSLDYRRPGRYDSGARRLGVMLIFSKSVEVLESGVIERSLFLDRTAWATIVHNGKKIKILGLHSIAGCSYQNAKSVQYDTFTEFIDEYKPDIIGMDANEPNVDSYDIDKMGFYNKNGVGAKTFFKTVKELNMQDAYVAENNITTCEEGKCLAVSYNVRRRGVVRYAFLFCSKDIQIIKCNYDYDGAVRAGSDHALIGAVITVKQSETISVKSKFVKC